MRRRNAQVIDGLLKDGADLSDDDRALLAQLIVGAGERVGRWWLEHREVPPEQVKARFTAALAGAISWLESPSPGRATWRPGAAG